MQLTQATTPAPVIASINEISSPSTPWLVTIPIGAEIFADAGQTESAIRANIFKAEDRLNSRGERIAGNGLAQHGAIIRRGRKVLLDVRRYADWLAGREPAQA